MGRDPPYYYGVHSRVEPWREGSIRSDVSSLTGLSCRGVLGQ